MRILKIELCNLASLSGEHTIDFTQEPLSTANLYAITGDTGAGKSTILDAICLALYAKTPRQKEATDYDKKQAEKHHIMRRGTRECYARVTFSMGDKHYRASWALECTSTGTLKTPQHLVEQVRPTYEVLYDKNSKVDNAFVPTLIGLNYEQFTRTVLLAQNSFANFLKAGDKEKSALLQRITGTEIYTLLSKEIHQRKKQADQAVDRLNSQMEGVGKGRLLDAVEAEEKQDKQSLLHTQYQSNAEEQKRVASLLQWYADKEACQAKIDQSEQAYNRAVQRKNERATEATTLLRYDSVQHLRDDYRSAERFKAEVAVTRQAFTRVKEDIMALSAQHKEATDAKIKAEVDFHNASLHLEQRMPNIEEGLRLEERIKQEQKHLAEATQEQEGLRKKAESNRHDLQARTAEVEHLNDAIAKIGLYFTQNNRYERMVEHYGRLETQLGQLAKLTIEASDCNSRRVRLLQEHDTLAQAETSATEGYNSHLQRCSEVEARLQQLQASIAGQNPNELHAQQQKLAKQVELLEQIVPLWHTIVKQSDTNSHYQLDISRTKSELAQIDKDLPAQQQRVAKYKQKADEQRDNYNRAENISAKELRRTLKSGDPCPVCGSGHHPWHTEQGQEAEAMGLLTEALRQTMEEAAEDYRHEEQLLQELSLRQSSLEAHLNAITKSAEDIRQDLQANLDMWHEKALQVQGLEPKVEVSNDREVRMRLQQLLEQQSRAAQLADEQLAHFNAIQSNIDQQQRLLTQLRNEGNTLNDALKTAQIQLRENRQAQENNSIAHQHATDAIARLSLEISEVVSMDDWHANAESFATHLKGIYNDWCDKQKQQRHYQDRLATAQQALAVAQTTAQKYADDDALLIHKIEASQKDIRYKKQSLMADFALRTPTQEREALTQHQQACRKHHEEAMAHYNKLSLALEKAEGQCATLEQTLADYEQKHTEAESRLLRGVTDYNSRYSMLEEGELRLLFDATTDWQHLRETIAALDKAVEDAKRQNDTAHQALNTLLTATDRPDGEDETPEALIAQQTLLQDTSQSLRKEIEVIAYQLRQHKEAKTQLGVLNEQLQALQEDQAYWLQLDKLIGGDTTDLFNSKAQAYSFGFLIERANVQLQQISRRYRLCRQDDDSLSLYVQDLDMGGEARPSASLSGGETFIVSLALALALTDLSTGGTRIESLFIDEGFGTLDANSLTLVLQTLDRLHSTQNRQVGIISHAEAIKQNVRPNIDVKRTGEAGASTIHIKL